MVLIERFIGILIEHYAGAFLLWLSPTQIAVLPVNNDAHLKHAKSVVRKLEKQGLRVELDDSNEKLGYCYVIVKLIKSLIRLSLVTKSEMITCYLS